MKQIISFEKELKFNTRVNEICSISLEHNYSKGDDDGLNGEFYITGDYKISDISVNKENFNFKVPFNIELDRKYNTSKSEIEIDDFYYELVNNELLKVNIDVVVDNIEEKELEEERIETYLEDEIGTQLEEEQLEIIKEEEKELVEDDIKGYPDFIDDEENITMGNDTRDIQDLFKEIDTTVPVMKEDNNLEELKNIFNDDSETFVTYHVHIVRENDTVETICTKYNISKEELSDYNDLNEIIIGNKVIVPVAKDEKDK